MDPKQKVPMLLTLGAGSFLDVGGCPMCCRVLNSVGGGRNLGVATG